MSQAGPNDVGAAGRVLRAISTRRQVLDFLLGVSFISWVAVVVFPILKFLRRPEETSGGHQKVLRDDDRKKIQQDGFAIVRLGTDRVIVFQDAQKTLRALQAKCTHEGCTVTYKASERFVWCACHNGKFDIDGRVISGPPPKPLVVFSVKGSLTSELTLSRQGG